MKYLPLILMGVFLVVLLSILYGQKGEKEEPEKTKPPVVKPPAPGPTGPSPPTTGATGPSPPTTGATGPSPPTTGATGPVNPLSSLAQKFLKAVQNNVPNRCSNYGNYGNCSSAGYNAGFGGDNGIVKKGCCQWSLSDASKTHTVKDQEGNVIRTEKPYCNSTTGVCTIPSEYQTTCWQGDSGEFCLGKPENTSSFSPGFCSNCMQICQLDDNTIDYDCMATVCPDREADHSDGDCFSTGNGMGCLDCDIPCQNMKEDNDINKALKKECVSKKCSALCDANKINTR